MFPQKIPQDINVELLLSYFAGECIKVSLNGLHKRNTYNDILDTEFKDGTFLLNISRNSIYNTLPENLFHQIDRFANLHEGNKDEFHEEADRLKHECENARSFFSPVDTLLLYYRMMTREELRNITESNSVLYDILSDRLTEEQRQNRFIKQTIPLLPACKTIRGNKTLLTLLLRKVFFEDGIVVRLKEREKVYHDEQPQYVDSLGKALDDTFLGNIYDELVTTFEVYFWPEIVDAEFLTLIDEIEMFRLFLQDYFMSVEEVLEFDIKHDDPALRLSDDNTYNYLNYNANL